MLYIYTKNLIPKDSNIEFTINENIQFGWLRNVEAIKIKGFYFNWIVYWVSIHECWEMVDSFITCPHMIVIWKNKKVDLELGHEIYLVANNNLIYINENQSQYVSYEWEIGFTHK